MGKKRVSIIAVISCVLMLSLSLSAFAATANFSATLPKNQGDTEVSKVRKDGTTSYFTITITSIGTGTDKVCAWTESDILGTNYSNPSQQVAVETRNITYSKKPESGDNVVLNLDNPVNMSSTVAVKGSWSPN